MKSPGNVNAFNNFFSEIGGFDFIDISSYTKELMYFPEMDALSLNFQNAGFADALVISNMGFLFYILLGHVFAIPLVLLLNCCGKKFRRLKPITDRSHRYMFYGGSIRFFMEGYLDICMFSLMNVKALDWSGTFLTVTICNYVAVIFTTFACLFPVFVLVWYICRMHLWHSEEFKGKWGALLDDLDIDKKDGQWIVIIFPVSYFLRRLSFTAVLVFWYEFLWGQIAIMAMLSVAMIIFILWFRPMESNFVTNIETFNECIALCIIYLMMSMSDAVPDVEARSIYGQFFIVVISIYLGVHMVILFSDICYKIKLRCHLCFSKCRR